MQNSPCIRFGPSRAGGPNRIGQLFGLAVLGLLVFWLATGCGSSGSHSRAHTGPPQASTLAQQIGCTGGEKDPAPDDPSVREQWLCNKGGDNITIDTYNSNTDRNLSVNEFGPVAVAAGETLVTGDRWVIGCSAADSSAIAKALGGAVTGLPASR